MAALNSNLRICWDNAADRGILIASDEAGNLGALNLRQDLKSKVWRALSTRAVVSCLWDSPEPVGVVALAFTNFTSQAIMRVRGYTRPESLIPEYDSGDVICAPMAALGQFPWGTPLGENFYARGGASLFSYGYGGYGTVWVPGGRAFRRLDVEINDINNPDTYLEAGRLLIGPWWSPQYNFDFGHNVEFIDSTQSKRTENGDLRGERSAKWRKISFDLSNMRSEDRAMMARMLRRFGVSEPFFISLFPENTDKLLEQSYQLWGKFVDGGRISQPRYDFYTTTASVEEM